MAVAFGTVVVGHQNVAQPPGFGSIEGGGVKVLLELGVDPGHGARVVVFLAEQAGRGNDAGLARRDLAGNWGRQ